MLERLSLPVVLAVTGALLAGLFAVGWLTRVDPSSKPVIEIAGGGFIVNYRLAEMYYGFTAVVKRPLPSGSIIEAQFEDPAGGAPFIVRERVSPMTDRYMLRSPNVGGVKAGTPYHVAIRVLDREATNLIWAGSRDYRSRVASSIVPDAPLTIGPGYARNPQAGQGD